MEAWYGRVYIAHEDGVHIRYNSHNYKFIPGSYLHLEEGTPVIMLTDDDGNALVVPTEEYYEWFMGELEPNEEDSDACGV